MRGPAAALLSVSALLGLVASGCSIKDDNPDLIAGKQLFVQRCGSCHVLDRAGTKGVSGPDLDEAFHRSRVDGFGDESIRGVVKDQIAHPSQDPYGADNEGLAVMPADLVTGEDAEDVAAYVAAVAAKGGEDTGRLAEAVATKQSDRPAVAKGGVLEIPADANGQLLYAFKTAQAPAGPLRITMPNESGVPHNIAIEGGETGPVVEQGESTIEVDLEPGTYTFVCTVPGHAEAGMKGELKVE